MPDPPSDHPPPARYLPFIGSRYEIAPGLFKFGRDFGNGVLDQQVFQMDHEFGRYRDVKLASRVECLSRYYCVDRLEERVSRPVLDFIAQRLRLEHPRQPCPESSPRTLDDIAPMVQEDLAIVSCEGDRNWISAIHLCFPNHWAAEDKIGRDFAAVHAPVAGIEPISRNAAAMVQIMLGARDGLLRFAWGMATDNELNHHPTREAGRSFNPARPRAFVRVERQTIWGFADVGAALFTIRTSFLDCAEIRQNQPECASLCSAIRSMTPESLAYKGLASWRDNLLAWLESTDDVR